MPTTTLQAPTNNTKAIEFCLKAPNAKEVSLAGSFNNWDPTQAPMRKGRGGLWKTSLPLSPGRYEYRFVADGEWITDPAAAESVPNEFGDRNAICVV